MSAQKAVHDLLEERVKSAVSKAVETFIADIQSVLTNFGVKNPFGNTNNRQISPEAKEILQMLLEGKLFAYGGNVPAFISRWHADKVLQLIEKQIQKEPDPAEMPSDLPPHQKGMTAKKFRESVESEA